jgi:two-component system, OmpR family, sensor kinase
VIPTARRSPWPRRRPAGRPHHAGNPRHEGKRRPRRLLPATLRGRLIAGLVALLAIACATVGLVTYLAAEKALSGEVNNELQTATGLAHNCWESQFNANKNDEGGQDSHQATSDPSAAPSASASSPSSVASTSPFSEVISSHCPGLGENTFVAVDVHGKWMSALVGDDKFTLTAADKASLDSVPAWSAQPPNGTTGSGPYAPTHTRYLSGTQSTYLLTAVYDRDGDGSVYVTGLPLATEHDQLRDIAIAEAVVFGAVLAFAGVLGMLWVRFSLRPLRRVAVTASQVAELPLESGVVSLPAGVPDTDPDTETGQVGLAFNRMLGHVETALRHRAASESRLRRFAADASHELRTPLAAIRGYAELALRHPGDSPDAVKHALGRVLSESTRMTVLVDDLLLLARLDAGRPLGSEPVDMTRLAIEATSNARVARPGHRWVLELPDDPLLTRGDEHRLHQVLGNLLSNAGRHTPDGTVVTVGVSESLPEGEPGTGEESAARGTLPPGPRLVLTVTDNGPGIPANLLPDLFERFTRADTSRSHASNASSTGLGLAIVDAVVAAHHGAVLLTSRPGMTRFTIVLARLAEASAPSAPHEPARTGRGTPSRAR